MTVPLVLILTLVFAHVFASGRDKHSSAAASNAPLPAVSVAAPPAPDAAATTACTAVDGKLPLTLNGLAGRPVHSAGQFVDAWGNPAVILRCGVARPKALTPSAQDLLISPADGGAGVYWVVSTAGDANVYTSIDRAAYIEVTVPAKYGGTPMPVLSGAIALALPPVCDGNGAAANVESLCTRRK